MRIAKYATLGYKKLINYDRKTKSTNKRIYRTTQKKIEKCS